MRQHNKLGMLPDWLNSQNFTNFGKISGTKMLPNHLSGCLPGLGEAEI
ncbi:hypothetical protein [Moorena producens]|nr:hypothetical protein [Moorena producens]